MAKPYFIRKLRYQETQRSYLLSLPKEFVEAFEWEREDKIMIQPEIVDGVFTQRFIIKDIDKRPHAMLTVEWFDHWGKYVKDEEKLKKKLSTHSEEYIYKRRTSMIHNTKFKRRQDKALKDSPDKVKYEW